MIRLIFLLLIMTTVVADAGGAITTEKNLVIPIEDEYISVDVDRSEMSNTSVIRLTLDIQFDDAENSVLLESMTKSLDPALDSAQKEREKAGYLITLKLPIAESWRQNGKKLKIKITASTENPEAATVGKASLGKAPMEKGIIEKTINESSKDSQ